MTTLDGALADLKRRGSVSLVVGSVPRESYVRVSRRMLGEAGSDPPRRRLLVVPAAERGTAIDRLRATGPLDRRHAGVIACNGTARGAAAGTTAGDDRPPVRRIDGGLDEVGGAITDAIDRFDPGTGGFAPAELRVGIDPLPDRLGACDTRGAFAFLHAFARQVRRADGLAHVRLPRDRDDDAVERVAPLADALLELRLDGYRLEQRWHLREADLVSDWIEVPDDGGTGRGGDRA
ncbi:MAG: hypothetical protein ABEH40_03750 [Haloferacaceae archaeon]